MQLKKYYQELLLHFLKSCVYFFQKILKTQIHESTKKSSTVSKHLPITYTECGMTPENIDGKKYVLFYLPASSHSKEYTILKFYPLNSLMATAILRNNDTEVRNVHLNNCFIIIL